MHAQTSNCEAVTLASLKDLNSFPVEISIVYWITQWGEIESMWFLQHIKLLQKKNIQKLQISQ